MQRRFFWIYNLVPEKLWDTDFNIDEDTNCDFDGIICYNNDDDNNLLIYYFIVYYSANQT